MAGFQGFRVVGAEDPLNDGQQRAELVAGPRRIPRRPGPAGEVGAGGQGIGMLGPQNPLNDGQQRGELVAGPRRIPRLPGPAGQVGADGQGIGVLGPQNPLNDGQQDGGLVAGPRGKQPKLKPAQAREVRRMHDSGDYSIAGIAEMFNVSRPTVYRVLQRSPGDSGTERPGRGTGLPVDNRPLPDVAKYDELLPSHQ